MEELLLTIPNSDLQFVEDLAKRMKWHLLVRKSKSGNKTLDVAIPVSDGVQMISLSEPNGSTDQEADSWLSSIRIHGGKDVPADAEGIECLIEEKYSE